VEAWDAVESAGKGSCQEIRRTAALAAFSVRSAVECAVIGLEIESDVEKRAAVTAHRMPVAATILRFGEGLSGKGRGSR
jgi:hypothetical protein